MRYLAISALLIVATILESSGDAVVRVGLFDRVGIARVGMLIAGGTLLFGYGVVLNLAPISFDRVVGIYVGTLFVVWQVVNFITYRTVPSLPVIVGGFLIMAGGLIVAFWGNSAGTSVTPHA